VGANFERASKAGNRNGAVTNEESFEALFSAEYGRVAGIANRVLADPHEAEDVAQ
jgi:DNA-directed RNA polymerase specialized sigma24 family protein